MIPHMVHTPVKLGDANEEVRELQRQLRSSGDYHGQIDGQYGTQTQQAVKAFQEARGLPGTGECDAETWAAVDPISVIEAPTKDVYISDGPHFEGSSITFGALVRSGCFEVGELEYNCWIQTDVDGEEPRAVWESRVTNDEPLEAGTGITHSWAVAGLEAGHEYLAVLTVNVMMINDSVQDENNWMLAFTWDGSQPTEHKQIR